MVHDHLEKRIAELERRTTHYRNAFVLLVLALCGMTVVGAAEDDGVIQGREQWLVDATGKQNFAVFPDSLGGGVLGLWGESGKVVLTAGSNLAGAGQLTLHSEGDDDGTDDQWSNDLSTLLQPNE